jgi:hypothetical protein
VNAYIRPLLRFWWVLALGLVVALVAGILVVDKVKLGFPPKLHTRATPQYQADAQLVVDSAQGWLFRSNVRVVTTQPPKPTYRCIRDAKTGKQTCKTVPVPQEPTIEDQTPNVNLLVSRANIYPSLIESTPFLAYRDKLYPDLPKGATMTATALGATRSGGRIHASPVPFDVISVTAKTQKAAVTVANATLNAFSRWIDDQQVSAGIAKKDRIVIRPVVAPTKAVNTTASTTTLAALIAVLVFGLFVALVYMLERAMPRGEKVVTIEETPSPSASAQQGRREREREDVLVGPEYSRARASDSPL